MLSPTIVRSKMHRGWNGARQPRDKFGRERSREGAQAIPPGDARRVRRG
jgi:hypothetical protein